MDGVTALIAALLSALRAMIPSDACPGGWPWAVSALGIGVGLLPTAGAVLVAVLRRRIGSRYGVGEATVLIGAGVLTAGLLPLLAFTATGRLFSAASTGADVPGLASADLDDLRSSVCFVDAQATYLGAGTVRQAFPPEDVLQGVFAVVLVLAPLLSAMFVAAQARLALRRGPSWPSKFFWLPTLALALLTAATPAGSSAHLWLGAVVGTFAGIIVALLVGVPSRETVRRSLAEPDMGQARRPEAVPAGRPEPAWRPQPAPVRPAGRADPTRPEPVGAVPVSELEPEPPPRQTIADRLAERFAARPADPPVLPTLYSAPPVPGTPGPTPTLHAPLPGDLGVPRFRLLRRLGAGGFGKVWLAHDARFGHTVALKAAHAPDAETEQRIQREARALAAVRHPHCVRILDLVHAKSDPGLAELDGMVIVMEYVEGSSLGELVRGRGPLDDIAAARAWASVAGALDAAHGRGVMHRDVKPGNVVVDPGGLAHLIDFGIARRTGDATMTLAGFVLGTPDFLSPEVASGERATPASDSWQLAATVSYALTGHPPRGSHPDAVSGLRAAAAGAPLSHLPARSAHLALLRASLDTDPARRPALSAAHRALEDWLRRAGARPDGPVTAGTARL